MARYLELGEAQLAGEMELLVSVKDSCFLSAPLQTSYLSLSPTPPSLICKVAFFAYAPVEDALASPFSPHTPFAVPHSFAQLA